MPPADIFQTRLPTEASQPRASGVPLPEQAPQVAVPTTPMTEETRGGNAGPAAEWTPARTVEETPTRRRHHTEIAPERSEDPITVLQQAMQAMNRQLSGQLTGISGEVGQLRGAVLTSQKAQEVQGQ